MDLSKSSRTDRAIAKKEKMAAEHFQEILSSILSCYPSTEPMKGTSEDTRIEMAADLIFADK